MLTRVQKWGDNIALRKPKAFAEEMRIAPGAIVELTMEGGRLVVAPVGGRKFALDELLAGIAEDNLHPEVDWGAPAQSR